MIYIKKISIVILNLLLNNYFIFKLFGIINGLFLNKKFNTVFLMYPASKSYASKYIFSWYEKYVMWSPILIGVFKQGYGWGLVFGVSATEDDFYNEDNLGDLSLLNKRVDSIKQVLSFKNKRYAGVLPSIFVSKKIIQDPLEGDATVAAVISAVYKLITDLKLNSDTPIVLLGSMGFIGRGVLAGLKLYKGEIYPIDIKNGDKTGEWPAHLNGKDLIVLNVTKKGALSDYIGLFWDKVVVLNEVYPEPSDAELKSIKAAGARCFHLVGVEGKAWPSFPASYSGGIPCCAASFTVGENKLTTIIREL